MRLLHVLGEERGCLLVLEDLHWADRESLSILEYLADNLTTEGVVCLATLRADEGGAGRSVVDSLVARRAARAVELARLDDEATLDLARACLSTHALPAAVDTFLRAHADGLPFLIEELLAGLVARGALVEHDGQGRRRNRAGRPVYIRCRLPGRRPPPGHQAAALLRCEICGQS